MEPSCANLIILVFFLCTTRFENQLLMFLITLGELLDGNTQLQAVCMDILLIWFTYIESLLFVAEQTLCVWKWTIENVTFSVTLKWGFFNQFLQPVTKVSSQKPLNCRKMYLQSSSYIWQFCPKKTVTMFLPLSSFAWNVHKYLSVISNQYCQRIRNNITFKGQLLS